MLVYWKKLQTHTWSAQKKTDSSQLSQSKIIAKMTFRNMNAMSYHV